MGVCGCVCQGGLGKEELKIIVVMLRLTTYNPLQVAIPDHERCTKYTHITESIQLPKTYNNHIHLKCRAQFSPLKFLRIVLRFISPSLSTLVISNRVRSRQYSTGAGGAHLQPGGPGLGSGRGWRARGTGCVWGSQAGSRWTTPTGAAQRRNCGCCASLCSAWTASSGCSSA